MTSFQDEMKSLIDDFLKESQEGLNSLDEAFVALEQNPEDRERLAAIFRTFHSIKGSAGVLGFTKLQDLAHSAENLLVKLRDGALRLTPEMTTSMLETIDAVRGILASIEKTREEGDGDYGALIETLARYEQGEAAPASADRREKTEGDSAGAVRREDLAGDKTLRVDVERLDRLMNLVGELVLARNQILKHTISEKGTALAATTQRLNLVTSELQESVMKTRLQPIGAVWRKFPRVVRDLSTELGKKVRLDMDGEETELDKSIIEAIKDPLTHLVRNSVDHGIEPPGQRSAAGKPAEGVVFLRAFHEAGHVIIEVGDDGAGLSIDRIRERAAQKGLLTAKQAAQMSECSLARLIFEPGFSTAEKTTHISGRGVGMDVVKNNIEKIGGSVDLLNRPGQGVTVKIRIPLTLAIISALLVTSGGERFAIPQVHLLELLRLEGEEAARAIENLQGAPVYRLRGRLLPLVYMDQVLQMRRDSGGARREAVNIVVLKADEHVFGLVVEGISDTEEIVVKPLGSLLKGIPCFAGAAVMGDGTIALILDVMGLAQSVRLAGERRETAAATLKEKRPAAEQERQAWLLFQAGDQRRLAIPLSQVARLEEFHVSKIETSNGRPVVQYGGRIMPLVFVAQALCGVSSSPAAGPGTGNPLQVIVFADEDGQVGLVVDRILDIVEEVLTVTRKAGRAGLAGSALIQGKVTDLLDGRELLRRQALQEAA